MTGSITPEQTVSPLVIRGVAWNGTSRLATRGIQFIVTLILARLLVPTDFGLAGMAAIVTMLGGMVSELGFGVAIVQKKVLHPDDAATAFWTSVLLGVVITALIAVGAPLAAAAFNSTTVTPIIRWSSLGLLIGSLAVTPQAILVRRMEFRSIAAADIWSSVVYAIAAVSMAMAGYGVWSIVVAGLLLGIVRTAIMMRRSGVHPRPVLKRERLREILPFGLRMFGSNIVQYLRSNLDYFVVGATLGPAPLGLYTMAFKLADFPRLRLASTITEVALPRMSAVQDEHDEVVFTYTRSLTGVTMITFPLLFGLAMLAPEFIRLAYGVKWEAAIRPLQILLMMGMLQSVADVAMTTIVAKGHAGTYLSLSLWYLAAVGVCSVIGVRWGITGVALGVSAATGFYLVLVQSALEKVLHVGPAVTLKSMAVPAGASAFMVAMLFVIRGAATHYAVMAKVWLPTAVVLGAVGFAAAVIVTVGPARVRGAIRAWRDERDAERPTIDVVQA